MLGVGHAVEQVVLLRRIAGLGRAERGQDRRWRDAELGMIDRRVVEQQIARVLAAWAAVPKGRGRCRDRLFMLATAGRAICGGTAGRADSPTMSAFTAAVAAARIMFPRRPILGTPQLAPLRLGPYFQPEVSVAWSRWLVKQREDCEQE